ncbi:hypothetical protein QBZ16_004244 [Prototheca wickerhamii]|uniref:SBP-type domain-containing protein n=1 Tax=Prototheca wickerhamii TaxID=3111 RepID=A0AAD9MGR4_PROWI|nr:hypothetical protein QBZ16_004244 [Prototheca wickerhamii]
MSSLESADPSWVSLEWPSDGQPSPVSGSINEQPSSSSGFSSEASTRPRAGRGSRGPRPRLFAKGKCQADGCTVDLLKLPYYYQRNHICTHHNKALSFHRQGEEVRFCQRCGVAHPLAEYQGTKRSCERQLARHNVRRRRLAADRQVSGPSPAASAPGPDWPGEAWLPTEPLAAARAEATPASSSSSAAAAAATESSAGGGLGAPAGADDDSVDGPGSALSAPALEGALHALQRQHADAYGFLVCRQLELAGALLAAAAGIVARGPAGNAAALVTA